MSAGRVSDGSAAAAAEAARRAAEAAAAAARRAAEAAAAKAAKAGKAPKAEHSPAPAQDKSSFAPAAPKNTLNLDGAGAPATTLLSENSKDASVNCLDKAADWVSKSSPELQSRSELVFLKDSRAGAEGQTGHVVVRQGERVLDPSSNKSYENMQAYLKEQPQYSEAGSLPGTTAAKVFATEPGSPERAQALADASVSPEIQQMKLADPVPNPATAQSFQVKVPGQVGPATVELSASLDKEVTKKDGFTTVKLTAELEATASGSVDLKKVSVGGGVSVGKTQTYEVKMTDADFERLKKGEIPPPNPLKPETIPDNASVTMESAQLKGWNGSVNAEVFKKVDLGLGEEHKGGKGLSIQTEKKGNNVTVTVGPKEVLEAGVSVSVGVGPASATVNGNTELNGYKLRTATFDLDSKEGRAAFEKYTTSGEFPVKDESGVTGAAKVERVDVSSKSELEVALGPLNKTFTAVPESTFSAVTTTHGDGSKDITIDDTQEEGTELHYERHLNPDGTEDFDKQKFSLFMKGLDGDVEDLFAHAYKVNGHDFDKKKDIELSFTPQQLTQMVDRAKGYIAQKNQAGLNWSPTGGQGFNKLIDDLSKAKNPGEVANLLLTAYKFSPGQLGQDLTALQFDGKNTPLPGTITAKDRNA